MKEPIIIPADKQWVQENRGNLLGNLYQTRNIDTSYPGVLRLSKRMRVVAQNTSGMGAIQRIVYGSFGQTSSAGTIDPGYIIISSGGIYGISADLETFGALSNSSTPTTTDGSDAVVWQGDLYVTNGNTPNTLSKLSGGTWTNAIVTYSSSNRLPMCVSSLNNDLLVGQNNLIKRRTPSGTNSTALTLPNAYGAIFVKSSNKRTFIGTINETNSNAVVFEWDETSPGWTDRYEIPGVRTVLDGEFLGSDFYVMAPDGRLFKFDGGGFSEEARLPIYEILDGDLKGRSVHRGMAAIEGKIHINIGTQVIETDNNFYETMPGGVWEYDPETGLTHAYGYSNSLVDTNNDFAILDAENTPTPGALAPLYKSLTTGDNADSNVGSKFLVGATHKNDTGTTYYSLMSVTTGLNRGVFSTTRIETSDVADDGYKLWVKYRGLNTSDDKIIVKYRQTERANLPFVTDTNIETFSSSTVVTSTNTKWAYAQAGDEVTIMRGPGAGSSVHISSISLATGTYTITFDEAITNANANDVCTCSVDNWTYLGEITSTDTDGFKDFAIPDSQPRTFTQYKLELRGNSTVTIEELQHVPQQHKLATD